MDDPEVAERLTTLATSANRRAAEIALVLPQVIHDSERCYQRLIELLADPDVQRSDFVMGGLSTLGRLRDNAEVARVGLARLQRPRGYYDGVVVATLAQHCATIPGIRDLAWGELHDREGPFAAIAQGFAEDADIRQRVAEMLTPLPTVLRIPISEALQETSALDPGLIRACQDYSWDEEPDVSAGAAVAFYRGRLARGELNEADLTRLREELGSYGPHYEVRRQAAFAALLEIGRGQVVDERQETRGDASPLRVPLGTWQGPNRVLNRQVLERWVELQGRYAGAVLARLSGERGEFTIQNEQRLWEQLAPDVDGFPAAHEQLRGFLGRAGDITLGSELLAYLSRTEPHSILLRDHCLRALAHEDFGSGGPFGRWETATDILEAQYSEDRALWNDVAHRIAGTAPEYGYLIALARGRPDHPTLHSAAHRLLDSPTDRPALAVFYALCAVASPSEVVSEAERQWTTGGPIGQWLFRPLVKRLGRDDAARTACGALLADLTTTQGRVPLAVALSAASPLPQRVVDELAQVLARELSGERPATFGYDPRVGRVRPLVGIVLDVLGGSISTDIRDE